MTSRFDETSPNASPLPAPMRDAPPAPPPPNPAPPADKKDKKENSGAGGGNKDGASEWPPKPGNRAGGRNNGSKNNNDRPDSHRGDDRHRNNYRPPAGRPGRPESPFTSFPTGHFDGIWNEGEPPTVVGDGFRPQKEYWVRENQPKDEKIEAIFKDSGKKPPTGHITKKAKSNGAGRNTESFDPGECVYRCRCLYYLY